VDRHFVTVPAKGYVRRGMSFLLTIPTLPVEVERALAVARSWFDIGYVPAGSDYRPLKSVAFARSEGTEASGDLHHSFGFYDDAVPDDCTEVHGCLKAFEAQVANLLPGYEPHRGSLRILDYPATDAPLRATPHSDYATFSILFPGPGFQVQIADEWVDLDAPGVVLFGDFIELYNPHLKPTRHQVIGPGERRVSLVYFSRPHAGTPFNGATTGEYLQRKLKMHQVEDR